jgi:predicted SAM-dependent methyltransferase
MKLHLGCGTRYLPGYIHIDISNYDHINIRTDIRKLSEIHDNSVDDIYASHVLEHFKRYEIFDILKEWNRVLKIGGTIHIAVPDFEACVEQYNQKKYLPELVGLLCGGQKNEYDHHSIIFDRNILTKFLNEAGFDNVKPYDHKEYLPEGFDDWSKCYLPHMDSIKGRHMSLNLVAKKKSSVISHTTDADLVYAMGIKKNYVN